MKEDVKLLKEQDIHTYCIVSKQIDGELVPTHFEFTSWVGDDILNFKAIPVKPHFYSIYFGEIKLIAFANINNFSSSMRRAATKLMKKQIQLPNGVILKEKSTKGKKK